MTTNKQEVQEEPVGWYTEDHLDDKSATTYKAEVAQRWRDKGWPVWPLYTAPQPAEQPISWIRISGDHVILSRCDWMYPASTEDSAGPRDEQRFTAVGRRDGDIVLLAPEGSLDREDMETMLAWSSVSKSVEQQPDVAQLVEALELISDTDPDDETAWFHEIADNALAAYRKQGGEP